MELWQRFTSHARAAVLYAHETATRLGHPAIETDHVLLGLLSPSGSGRGVQVLERLGVDAGALRSDLERRMDPVPAQSNREEIVFAPAAQHALQLAYAEARSATDQHIGTEHLLLGQVRLGEGAIYELLAGRGVTLDAARAELDKLGPRRPD